MKVFEHFRSLGLKPNAMSFSLLVDAHLVARDPKAALSIIDEMVFASSWMKLAGISSCLLLLLFMQWN